MEPTRVAVLPESARRDPRGFLEVRGYTVMDACDFHAAAYPIRVAHAERKELGRFSTIEEAVLCLAHWGRIF